jgi:hypothetical protein
VSVVVLVEYMESDLCMYVTDPLSPSGQSLWSLLWCNSVILKMEAAHSSETLVSTCDPTWCQNPEGSHLIEPCLEDLKTHLSCKIVSYPKSSEIVQPYF